MEGGDRRDRGTALTEWVSILFLAFAVFLLVTNILPTRRNLASLVTENDRVAREIEALREEQRRLNLRGDALQTDPQEIEKELRETLRLTRPGEKILK